MEEPIKFSLQLSDALLNAAREVAKKKGFGSVEEFLISLLRKEVEGEEETISEEEKEKIRKRLRDLGYLE